MGRRRSMNWVTSFSHLLVSNSLSANAGVRSRLVSVRTLSLREAADIMDYCELLWPGKQLVMFSVNHNKLPHSAPKSDFSVGARRKAER